MHGVVRKLHERRYTNVWRCEMIYALLLRKINLFWRHISLREALFLRDEIDTSSIITVPACACERV